MSTRQFMSSKPAAVTFPSFPPVRRNLLQRKCACGGTLDRTGECEECRKKRLSLQTKLKVNRPGDTYEQEADRIADRVMSTPPQHAVTGAPVHIQRFAEQPDGQFDAPASVDHALASPGQPLESALRQDMEQRFGHDFSRVRVHSGAAAEQSARDVNARAYTVGHNIVFSGGQFIPGTHEGRRLIAHELTHVVQQTRNVSFPTRSRIGNAESGFEQAANAMSGSMAGDRDSVPSSLTPQTDAPSASVGSSPALLQRAPDEKKPGTKLGGLNSPYPQEEAVLQHAIKVLATGRLSQGVVFYFTNDWKAIGLSSSAFVVGPFTSDMGSYFCVYRLKSSNEKKGTSTFSRGIYSGGWSGDKITVELYEKLAKVEGRTELEVKATSQTFTDPRDSLAFMMTVWTARGQLDSARLPQGVAAIPPLPITQEQHKQLNTHLSGPTAVAMIGGLQVVQSTGAAAQTAITGTSAGATATTFARGTGTFVAVTEEAAAGAAVETGTSTAAGRAATATRAGTAAIAAGITVFFWDMSEAGKGSTRPTSEITGQPYEGPGQREWEDRLTPKQKDYFRDQWRLRYGPPGPVPIAELQPTPTPTTQTEPDTRRRRRRRKCDRRAGPCPSWQPRLLRPNTYWNHAYEYRRANGLLGQYDFNQNVAVLLLEDEEPIREKNDMGFHSEQQIIWKLTKRGIDSGCPILGLFSERKPCQEICQKQVLPQLCRINNGVPFGVFFAIDYYNSSEGIKSHNNRHELIKSYKQAGYFEGP